MPPWLRRLVRLEDLLWALVVALLAPAEGGMYLEGGAVSFVLAGAGLLFWLAALSGQRGDPRPRPGWLLFMALGACTVVTDAGLREAGAGIVAQQLHVGALLLFGGFAFAQHKLTRGGAWLRLPRLARRAAAWPYLMFVGSFVDDLVAAIAGSSFWWRGPAGEVAFTTALTFLGVLPLCFAFFVVAPRRVSDPGEPASAWIWIGRYGLAVATGVAAAVVAAVV